MITKFQVFFLPAFWSARRVSVDFYLPFGLPRPPAFWKKNSVGAYESNGGRGVGCPCGPSGQVSCNLFRTRGAFAVRLPLSWWEGGGNPRRSFLVCAPAASARSVVLDFSFWLVQPNWDQFGDEASPGRSAPALKM